MTTTTTTLTDFLLARIAEDEAGAREAGPEGGEWFSRTESGLHNYGEFGWSVSGPDVETEDSEWGMAVADHIARHDPARVLTECAAKRDLVRRARRERGRFELTGGNLGNPIEAVVAYETALRIFAAVYSDHADYDPSWAVS